LEHDVLEGGGDGIRAFEWGMLAAAHRLVRDFLVMLQRYPWEKAEDVASPDSITIQTRANTKTIITMLTRMGPISHPIQESEIESNTSRDTYAEPEEWRVPCSSM
jgi:hypothetical protein